jgi:hypothetical protein
MAERRNAGWQEEEGTDRQDTDRGGRSSGGGGGGGSTGEVVREAKLRRPSPLAGKGAR